MKVTGVETFPIATPPPFRGGRNWMFVRLDTDAGISGYGEVMLLSAAFRLPVISQMIEDLVDQAVIGHDPYESEMLFDRIYGRSGYSHYPEQTKLAILSALEVACWDIVGKDLGQPIHRLLGGAVRDKIRTYTYLYTTDSDGDVRYASRDIWLNPQIASERARQYVDMGFTAIKLDPFALTVSDDQAQGQTVPLEFSLSALDTAEAVIGAIREELGSSCDILIGTHGQMTAAGAIRLARRLEQFDPLWLEEPLPPENMDELAKVARATTIPITTGERLTTKYDFARLISSNAAAIFNFDVGQVGGLLESKKIAAMAEASYLQIAPHVYNGPIVAAASIQLSLCCHNVLIMEAIERFDGLHAEIIEPAIEWRDGHVIPPTGPGLGFELREDVARRYAPDGPGPTLVRPY